MKSYSLTHLADSTLLRNLADLVARDCATTSELLAHIAEVEARRLFLPAGYSSMYAYCVEELKMSEDIAYKRIRAARAARQFPAILAAVAGGRLHLTAIVFLAPHLSEDNAAELFRAAEHKTKAEVELLVASRFPQPDLPTMLEALGPTVSPAPLPAPSTKMPDQLVPEPVNVAICQIPSIDPPAPHPAAAPDPRPRVMPLAPKRFGLQVTISETTHDKLREAQDLLGHQVAPGDVAQVLDLALDSLILRLKARKFAATDKPRPPRVRKATDGRYIPADVRRAVWNRDGGQCTFRSDTGHRCTARRGLQFDHVHEFARGGEAMVSDIRLLCRAHNQHEAEQTFGAEFMRNKRIAAGEARRAESSKP